MIYVIVFASLIIIVGSAYLLFNQSEGGKFDDTGNSNAIHLVEDSPILSFNTKIPTIAEIDILADINPKGLSKELLRLNYYMDNYQMTDSQRLALREIIIYIMGKSV